jgi:hypothetical protein
MSARNVTKLKRGGGRGREREGRRGMRERERREEEGKRRGEGEYLTPVRILSNLVGIVIESINTFTPPSLMSLLTTPKSVLCAVKEE